jgi:intein/homing endonuclease
MELFKNSKINNEIDAYLFGFIYADGFVTGRVKDKYYTLGITLAEKDSAHLSILNDYIQGNIKDGVVTLKQTNKSYKTTRLTKCSVKLVACLISLGITPDKTYRQQEIWRAVKPSLYSHFIRGFFDGDGTIYMGRSDRKYRAGFVGKNEHMFKWLAQILSEELNRTVKYKLERGSNCFRVALS